MTMMHWYGLFGFDIISLKLYLERSIYFSTINLLRLCLSEILISLIHNLYFRLIENLAFYFNNISKFFLNLF